MKSRDIKTRESVSQHGVFWKKQLMSKARRYEGVMEIGFQPFTDCTQTPHMQLVVARLYEYPAIIPQSNGIQGISHIYESQCNLSPSILA